MSAILTGLYEPYKVTGFLHSYWTYVSRWSCKFCPTPFRTDCGFILYFFNWSSGPMPESISNWGEFIAPADSNTSFSA